MMLVSSAVLVTFLLHVDLGYSKCLAGFPTLSTVQKEAVFIGDITSRNIQQNLIPGIRFRCAGTILTVTMVASQVGGGSRFPEFQIWRNTAGTQYDRIDSTSVDDSHATSIPYVYEKILDRPLQFEADDIIGIFTPPVPKLSFKYQKEGGPKNYYIGGPSNPYDTFSLDGAGVLSSRNDYPLMTVEISSAGCASGFIDRATLLTKAGILNGNTSRVSYRQATQRIVPDMVFTCNGQLLNLTVGALNRGSSSKYPEIQLWRRVDETSWIKAAAIGQTAAISSTQHLNVHVYTPVPPVSFQTGDILGLYQPYTDSSNLVLYLAGNGPRNYYIAALSQAQTTFKTDGTSVQTEDRLPLIVAEISTSTSSSSTSLPSTVLTAAPHPTTQSRGGTKRVGTGEVAGLIAAIIVCVLLIMASMAAIGVLAARERRRGNGSERATLSRAGEAADIGSGEVSDRSMDYNPMYQPRSPTDIISDGRRHTVSLQNNPAYHPNTLRSTGINRSPQQEEHIYESID